MQNKNKGQQKLCLPTPSYKSTDFNNSEISPEIKSVILNLLIKKNTCHVIFLGTVLLLCVEVKRLTGVLGGFLRNLVGFHLKEMRNNLTHNGELRGLIARKRAPVRQGRKALKDLLQGVPNLNIFRDPWLHEGSVAL